MSKLKKVRLDLHNLGSILLDVEDIVKLKFRELETGFDFDPKTNKTKKIFYHAKRIYLTIRKEANTIEKYIPKELHDENESLFDNIIKWNNIVEIVLMYKKKEVKIGTEYFDWTEYSNPFQTSELDDNGNLVIEIRERTDQELSEIQKREIYRGLVIIEKEEE